MDRGGGWCWGARGGGDGEFRDTASAGQGRPNKDVQRYDSSSYVDGWYEGNTNQQCRDGGRGGGSVLCAEWRRAGSVAPHAEGDGGADVQPAPPTTCRDPLVIRGHGCGAIEWIPRATASTRGDVERARTTSQAKRCSSVGAAAMGRRRASCCPSPRCLASAHAVAGEHGARRRPNAAASLSVGTRCGR